MYNGVILEYLPTNLHYSIATLTLILGIRGILTRLIVTEKIDE